MILTYHSRGECMLKILFFCVLLSFSICYTKSLMYLVERRSWRFQLIFSLFWILPELLVLFVCYHMRMPEMVIFSMIESFLILMICFGLFQFLFSLSFEKSASRVYLISLFLYMMVVLNLSLTNIEEQMLFGICVPSLLFLAFYIVSLLFEHEKVEIPFMNSSWKNILWSMLLLGCLTFLFEMKACTKETLLLMIVIPKGYAYYRFAHRKINLTSSFFYDGMVRFYLVGLFDIIYASGVIYHVVYDGTLKITQGMIYLILMLYLYCFPLVKQDRWVSLLVSFSAFLLFLWKVFQ